MRQAIEGLASTFRRSIRGVRVDQAARISEMSCSTSLSRWLAWSDRSFAAPSTCVAAAPVSFAAWLNPAQVSDTAWVLDAVHCTLRAISDVAISCSPIAVAILWAIDWISSIFGVDPPNGRHRLHRSALDLPDLSANIRCGLCRSGGRGF